MHPYSAEGIGRRLQEERNCCIRGARNWCPGTTQGQIGTIEIAADDVLCERSLPELLERPEVPISTPPEGKLPLANSMGQLDAGQRNRCTPERLESSHRGASALDRSMILLNEIVEVLATPHLYELPLRVLPPQKPKGYVALLKAIERDLARPSR